MSKDLFEASLHYHRHPKPGKLEVVPTKALATQRDLSLAYSPGVASTSQAIAKDPKQAHYLTCRSNLVGVITNGTAVLGLGAVGPLAAKPVMEGKAVLFKKFAGINVFDIEVDATDPQRFVDIVASLEPTFGGINLEDIKAPECFYIERTLQERMNIPVFHDDQHGTAIIVCAAIKNALLIMKKDIKGVKLVVSGAGAAALSCVALLEQMGLLRENIFLSDIDGAVFKDRTMDMMPEMARYAHDMAHRTLSDLIQGADIFLGLSAGNLLTPEMLRSMAEKPIIMALANPTPEVDPKVALEVRPDAIVATGRSDFPNQVNNVLCFPFIFRGALDVGATCINIEMKMAAIEALAKLARVETTDVVNAAYGVEDIRFGKEYIIPKPFDPRLMMSIAPAVAKAAMDSGVATRPIEDLDAYRHDVSQHFYLSGLAMKPIFSRAKKNPRRVVFSDGEDTRILRAAQDVADEGLAHPILIGRRRVVTYRLEHLGLRLQEGRDFTLVDPEQDDRFTTYWTTYLSLRERHGITPDLARTVVRTNTTVIAALMVYLKEADAMISGPTAQHGRQLKDIASIIDYAHPHQLLGALSVLVTLKGIHFFTDGYVNKNPTAQEIVEITQMAATQVREFGIIPKVALLSHSNFGSLSTDSSMKLREALAMLHERCPDLEVEGEMQADAALCPVIRERIFPNSKLTGSANLFVMPNIESANIAFNMAKSLTDAHSVGPMILGLSKSAHVLSSATTVRGILNMTAYAVSDALRHEKE